MHKQYAEQRVATSGMPPVVVALDYRDLDDALVLVDALLHPAPLTSWFKIGCELFARYGREAVDKLRDRGCDIFVDLKVNGLPRTDFALGESISGWGVRLVDIHLTLGAKSAERFIQGLGRHENRPRVLGVTVLTSYASVECLEPNATRQEVVLRLARIAKSSGLDGVVAAAGDARCIKEELRKDFLVVTPGIRPSGTSPDEQRQVSTPGGAVHAGADFLVVGRPITRVPSPADALRSILDEVEGAFSSRRSVSATDGLAGRAGRGALRA